MKSLKELKKLAKTELGGNSTKVALLGDTATPLPSKERGYRDSSL